MAEKSDRLYPEKYFSKLKAKSNIFTTNTKSKRKSNRKRKYYNRKIKIEYWKTFKKGMPVLEQPKINLSNAQKNLNQMTLWQYQHQLTYWKGRAISLEHENKILHEKIRSIYDNFIHQPVNKIYRDTITRHNNFKDINETQIETEDRKQTQMQFEVEEENSNADDEETEFIVSDEWLNFMAQNARFRLERDKKRELEKLKDEPKTTVEEILKNKETEQKLKKQNMIELYGDGMPLITGWEAAMQVNYNQCVADKSPIYWPNIPFRA